MDQDTTRNLILLAIAAFQALTAVLTFMTRSNIKTLEQNTNSKMDKLLVSTASASEAKGRDDQRAIGEQKAVSLASAAVPVPVTDEKTAAAVEKVASVLEGKKS